MEHLARWFINSGISGVHQTTPIHWDLDGRIQHRLDDRSKAAQQSLPVIGLLWNPRLLPFVYVLRYMLAVMGAYEVCAFLLRFVRLQRYARTTIARSEFDAENGDAPQVRRPSLEMGMNSCTRVLWLVTLFALVVLGFRYQQLPGGRFVTSGSKTKYAWGPIQVPANRGFSDGWARWNFQGYEGKSSYGEYHGVVQMMLKLGDDPAHGCGRAVWENNGELNKYGTTMGLMLLPFWTKGCIASMEGLFLKRPGPRRIILSPQQQFQNRAVIPYVNCVMTTTTQQKELPTYSNLACDISWFLLPKH